MRRITQLLRDMAWRIRVRRLARRAAIVLVYHAVAPASARAAASGRIHNVTPAAFDRHMAWLRTKFHVRTIDDLVDARLRGEPLAGTAAVTFDDGYRSVVEYACPLLRKHGIPATLFLTTSLLDGKPFWRDRVRYLVNTAQVKPFLAYAGERDPAFRKMRPLEFYRDTKNPAVCNSRVVAELMEAFLADRHDGGARPEEALYVSPGDIARLSASGVAVGNHSHSHYVLSGLSGEEQRRELWEAQRRIESLTGHVSRVFSVPFGQLRDLNAETVSAACEVNAVGLALSSGSRVADAREAGVYHGMMTVTRYMPPDGFVVPVPGADV